MTMNKRELVAAAARRTGLTRAQTREALDAFLDAIAAALATGDDVVLRDLGRFSTWRQRQPVTDFGGTRHQVSAPRVAFSASPTLRRRLDEDPT